MSYSTESIKMGFQYLKLRLAWIYLIITCKLESSHNVLNCCDSDDSYLYFRSAEWDLLELKSQRHEKVYSSCCGPYLYVDITFYFLLRRKTLFYTINLIVPCFLISVLTMLVFYLPDHKITLAISILVTLTVFFLVKFFLRSIQD